MNPNDPCCLSCGQAPGSCPPDPMCQSNPTSSAAEDDVSLRCFDQKRRFGIDALYPTSRYVKGLTAPTVTDVSGASVPNPLYSHLQPTDGLAMIRDPGMVVLAGLVGVPWQDVAKDPKSFAKGPMSSAELSMSSGGTTRWDVIAGNPGTYVAPLDPLMKADWHVRTGKNPVTGVAIAGPLPPDQNPINGNDYTIASADPNDLQYACVFPLSTPRDCSQPGVVGCDCGMATNDKPVCAPNQAMVGQNTLQTRAKAYPAPRQLAVLQGLEAQGVVGSVCAEKNAPTNAVATWYQPALDALHDRLKARLLPGK